MKDGMILYPEGPVLDVTLGQPLAVTRQIMTGIPAWPPPHDIRRAVANARRRWPALAEMVDTAAELVESDALHAITKGFVVCRPSDHEQGHLITLTNAKLSCTCDVWPPPIRAGPGDGLYCSDILAALLQIYLRRPFRQARREFSLACSPTTLWREALDELRGQMTWATFDRWLRDSVAVSAHSSPTLLTVAVRDRYAREWLTGRLLAVVEQTVSALAGHNLTVRFVCPSVPGDFSLTTRQ